MLGAQSQAGAFLRVLCLGVLNGGLLSFQEDLVLDLSAFGCLCLGASVHLFKDAWHTQNHVWLGALEGVEQSRDLRPQGLLRAADEHGVRHRASQHVSQRQEHQGSVARAARLTDGVGEQSANFREPVVMGQGHALGAARGAGGVHDGVDGCGCHLRDPPLNLGLLDIRFLAFGDEGIDGSGVKGEYPTQMRGSLLALAFLHESLQALGVPGIFREGHYRARILDDPLTLRRGGRRVNGDGDRSTGLDREVSQHPFETGTGHDGHAVARLHIIGDQTLGYRIDFLDELRRSDRLPLEIDGSAEAFDIRLFLGQITESGDHGLVLAHGIQSLCGEFRHFSPQIVT